MVLISSNVVFATFCPDPDPGIFCIRNLGNLCFWNPESWLWNLEYSSRNPESRRGSRIQDFLGSTIKIQRTIKRRAPFVRCGNLFMKSILRCTHFFDVQSTETTKQPLYLYPVFHPDNVFLVTFAAGRSGLVT